LLINLFYSGYNNYYLYSQNIISNLIIFYSITVWQDKQEFYCITLIHKFFTWVLYLKKLWEFISFKSAIMINENKANVCAICSKMRRFNVSNLRYRTLNSTVSFPNPYFGLTRSSTISVHRMFCGCAWFDRNWWSRTIWSSTRIKRNDRQTEE